uniref:Uncharacterized protein n=1 Tax=Octopus bimaculoides TaxID=37653 RepID=A0A0L8I1F1_OCTBM
MVTSQNNIKGKTSLKNDRQNVTSKTSQKMSRRKYHRKKEGKYFRKSTGISSQNQRKQISQEKCHRINSQEK